MVRPEFQNCQAAALEILLIAKVFVREDEEVETGAFRGSEQVAIGDSTPAHLLCGGDFVPGERMAHLHGDTFVQQNLHAANWCSMSCWLKRRTAMASSRGTEGNDSRK